LARKPFVVLDAEILSSSVWSEAAHVRLVWITLLILCDTEGYVGASVPGIASAAGVSLKEAEEAIAKLRAPDPYSRTKDNEGRRLEESERGWRVLNFLSHLDRLSSERKRARDRVWRHRQRAKAKETPCNDSATTEQRQSSQGVGSREQGIGNSTEVRKEDVPPAPPRGENDPPPFPSQRAADIYRRFYPKARPPRPMFKELRPLVTTHGWGVVAPELEAYLEGTDVRFHNWPKFSSGFGSWAKGRGPHRETPITACESCQEVAPAEGKLVCAECAEKIAAALKRQDDYKNSRATVGGV